MKAAPVMIIAVPASRIPVVRQLQCCPIPIGAAVACVFWSQRVSGLGWSRDEFHSSQRGAGPAGQSSRAVWRGARGRAKKLRAAAAFSLAVLPDRGS